MKRFLMKCPQCGGNLEVNEDQEVFFCQFCGAKIQMNTIDKSELKIKEMEHEERMRDKDLKDDRQAFIMLGVILAVLVLLIFYMMLK